MNQITDQAPVNMFTEVEPLKWQGNHVLDHLGKTMYRVYQQYGYWFAEYPTDGDSYYWQISNGLSSREEAKDYCEVHRKALCKRLGVDIIVKANSHNQ